MTRQLEAQQELRQTNLNKKKLAALEEGLPVAIGRAGGVLRGFSCSYRTYEVLLTLRADFPAGGQIAFVGSADLGMALIKAVRQGERDELKWRPDKWAKK